MVLAAQPLLRVRLPQQRQGDQGPVDEKRRDDAEGAEREEYLEGAAPGRHVDRLQLRRTGRVGRSFPLAVDPRALSKVIDSGIERFCAGEFSNIASIALESFGTSSGELARMANEPT